MLLSIWVAALLLRPIFFPGSLEQLVPLFREQTEAFIVRIWLERRESEDAPVERRGSVEHVSSGKRRYFTDLADMLHFIEDQLRKLGSSAN